MQDQLNGLPIEKKNVLNIAQNTGMARQSCVHPEDEQDFTIPDSVGLPATQYPPTSGSLFKSFIYVC